MEIWDAYTADLKKIEDMTLVRGEEASIPEGVYHLVCQVLVRHRDGSYLLMQRDPRKAFPLMWEATAGGSALKGEDPVQCALRELREETGIQAESLTELGRFANAPTHSVYVDMLCETDCAKDSVILQEGETAAYKWVSGDEITAMSDDELVSRRLREYIRNGVWKEMFWDPGERERLKIELTQLSAADREAIKALYCSVFMNEPWNDDWSDGAQLDAYITDLIGNPNSLTLGYFEDGRLVGVSMGLVKHWFRGTEYVIDEFCILTERQGAGLGSAFIEALERSLPERGIEHIFLQTDDSMPAYDFYKKRGFTELKGHVSFAKDLRIK